MKELLRKEKEDVGLRWIDVIYSTLQIYFKSIPGLSKAIKMLIRHEKKKFYLFYGNKRNQLHN